MTTVQRTVLAMLVAAVVTALGLFAFAASRDDGAGQQVVGAERSASGTTPEVPSTGAPATTAPTRSTTKPVVSSTPQSVSPSTTLWAGVPSTTLGAGAPATAGATGGRLASAQGSVLTPPSAPTVKEVPRAAGCQGLVDQGWSGECAVVQAKGATLAWVLQSKPRGNPGPGQPRRALVWRSEGGERWSLVLREADDQGLEYAGMQVRAADLSGDGAAELVVGFRVLGTGQVLRVHVVEGTEVVAFHQLQKGSARIGGGALETWGVTSFERGATCCPTEFEHASTLFADGAWRVQADTQRGPEVPSSQL